LNLDLQGESKDGRNLAEIEKAKDSEDKK